MSVEKTSAVILALTPYRETSCILRLFTEDHGLVHGVAKGVKKDAKSVPLDRGFLVETLLYLRPNRDLHTLGGLQVTDFLPAIRADLVKSAVRDTALELYLKSITQSGAHPELYSLLVSFLKRLESVVARFAFPLLWHFLHEYCSLAGFKINTEVCTACGNDTTWSGGVLQISAGSLYCPSCARSSGSQYMLTPQVVAFLDSIDTGGQSVNDMGECLRVTGLLLSYCRHHLDIRTGFKSLSFMETMLT